jgi:uncharacterized protein (DUF58 family)
MSEIFEKDFLFKLENLKMITYKYMNSIRLGHRKSKSTGSSVEFTDYRNYSIGDDYRRIDWKAYGRLNKLFIKLYTEEKEANINILLDISKSMDFGLDNKSYSQRRLALAFSYMGLNNMDKVNLYTAGSSVELILSDKRGKNSLYEIINVLENLRYNACCDITEIIKNDYKPRKGISIIISDLMPADKYEKMLRILKYFKQETYILHLLSEEEISPDIDKNTSLIDLETEMNKDFTYSERALSIYESVFAEYRKRLHNGALKYGVSLIDLISNQDILYQISEFIKGQGVRV